MSNSSQNTAILMDAELIRLCLDDGTTYVSREGEIMSADPKSAPKLDEIVQYVKALPTMIGKDIKVSQVTQEQVEGV
ncbi:MAG: GspE/PulE family protein, partial [Shewanella sp.]